MGRARPFWNRSPAAVDGFPIRQWILWYYRVLSEKSAVNMHMSVCVAPWEMMGAVDPVARYVDLPLRKHLAPWVLHLHVEQNPVPQDGRPCALH